MAKILGDKRCILSYKYHACVETLCRCVFFFLTNEFFVQMNNWYIILNQRDGPYRSEDLMGEMKEREKEREP